MIAHEMSETAMRVDMNTTRVSDCEEENKKQSEEMDGVRGWLIGV